MAKAKKIKPTPLAEKVRIIDEWQEKHSIEIAALQEAICPRVAARLTALEKILADQRFANQQTLERLNARLARQEERAITPVPTKGEKTPREGGIISWIVGYAKTNLSRAARHELITRLTDLNREG